MDAALRDVAGALQIGRPHLGILAAEKGLVAGGEGSLWFLEGGGFKDFLFSPLPGEMIQFDEHIFQMGWFNHQLGLRGPPPMPTLQEIRPYYIYKRILPSLKTNRISAWKLEDEIPFGARPMFRDYVSFRDYNGFL